MISQMINDLIGKRVRITGETFVEKGILLDLLTHFDTRIGRPSYAAWVKTQNGERCVYFENIRDLSLDIEEPEHSTMDKLSTIQKRENMNVVYRSGEPGPGGAHHDYDIYPADNSLTETAEPMAHIEFQRGPRKDAEARHGVLDTDLLEIVRDRLTAFQAGAYACRENACALTHIEEALMWMNRRVEDRIERNVLGTMEK